MKKIIFCIVTFFLLTAIPVQGEEVQFADVPLDHWSYNVTHRLRDLGVTNGVGNNNFGLGQPIKRGQFISFLARLMEWEAGPFETSSFSDVDQNMYYHQPIEVALSLGVITQDSSNFRPNEHITREEMAIMIVRTLGLENLARQLDNYPPTFVDVEGNSGYITIARDLGIIQGSLNNRFNPKSTANREHAAAMMVRMYDTLQNVLNEVHGFYAIQSFSQRELIPSLDSISFGWSRLEYEAEQNTIILNTTRDKNNVFGKPLGALEIIQYSTDNNVPRQLMVFAENYKLSNDNIGFLDWVLNNEDLQNRVIELIVNEVIYSEGGLHFYDGVVIDFELLRGNAVASAFNEFLQKLKNELNIHNKHLFVAVHPVRRPGEAYFDGYDYRTIGAIADKIILMAHDYSARKLNEREMLSKYTLTPLTPIIEIYYALQAITDAQYGVKDKDKIWLQLSFDSIQWKIQNNRIINETPFRPTYEAIHNRMVQGNVSFHYSKSFENPYLTFFNEEDNTDNVLWYEDSRSIMAKVRLAQLFGINGISLWRLGNIPNFNENTYLDIWHQIMKLK